VSFRWVPKAEKFIQRIVHPTRNRLHCLIEEIVKLQLFALLNLGIIQSLASGVLSATEAVQHFYHAHNCLYYIQEVFGDSVANSIMSHGVQLPDIFDCLSAEELSLTLLE